MSISEEEKKKYQKDVKPQSKETQKDKQEQKPKQEEQPKEEPKAEEVEADKNKALADEYLNLARVIQADFDNYRKRSIEQIEKAKTDGIA